MGRFPCRSKDAGLNRGAWTTDEDLILSEYIGIHGDGNWRALPKKAGLKRCGKSCRLRWLNYLRPDIKHGSISTDEDELIIKLHGLLGNRWSLIAGRLPGRTDNEIKNYWNKGLRKKLANIGSTVPQCRKINSLRPKSPSDPSRFKVNPVKTTAARIVKGLNKCKTTDNCNATPAHQDFTFLSDAPQIMKASKSWCDLLLDEMITENDLEFSETHNLFESNNLQYPHSQNSPQHRASTSKSFLSYRDYNLPTSQFDSSEDFMVDEFEARPSNDLKQMYPDINSNMQHVNSSTGCDEQMIEAIYNYREGVDRAGEFQCFEMANQEPLREDC